MGRVARREPPSHSSIASVLICGPVVNRLIPHRDKPRPPFIACASPPPPPPPPAILDPPRKTHPPPSRRIGGESRRSYTHEFIRACVINRYYLFRVYGRRIRGHTQRSGQRHARIDRTRSMDDHVNGRSVDFRSVNFRARTNVMIFPAGLCRTNARIGRISRLILSRRWRRKRPRLNDGISEGEFSYCLLILFAFRGDRRELCRF